MESLVIYFHKALTTLLERAFDPTAQYIRPQQLDGITPCPPPDTPSEDLIGHVSNKPVEDMLQASDLANYSSDLDCIETSATIHNMQHPMCCEEDCTKAHKALLAVGNAPGFVDYTVQWLYSPRNYWGQGHRMPIHIPQVLRRALIIQKLCEIAVIMLYTSVVAIVKQIDPNAHIHWAAVVPRRRFQLVFNDEGIVSGTHSILLILSPLAGDFVLDPTAEQYGFPREHRFLTWTAYKDLYIVNESRWPSEAVWSTRTESYMDQLERSEDWDVWKSLRSAIDSQFTAWLKGCDLKKIMDNKLRWNRKEEQLERMVTEELYWVPIFADSAGCSTVKPIVTLSGPGV